MVDYCTIDNLIVGASLLITLLIGWYSGRNVKTIRGYAIGTKGYGTLALVLTFLATNIGGASVLYGAGDVFTKGILDTFSVSSIWITMILLAVFIAPHMHRFKQCLTIGDVMKNLYGDAAGLLTGLLGTAYSICMVAMSLEIMADICNFFWQIDKNLCLLIGGCFLTFYVVHGGIKSVVKTDFFQFTMLLVVVSMIAIVAINRAGGVQAIWTQVPGTKKAILSHSDFPLALTLFLSWGFFSVGITSPPLFQRLLMAKKPQSLRRQYFITAAFDPLFHTTMMFIGLAGIVLYSNKSDMKALQVIPSLIQELPTGLKGVATAGLLAIILSTLDSYLHASGTLLGRNVVVPVARFLNNKKEVNELGSARLATFMIACMGMVVAYIKIAVMKLSFTAFTFTGPLLMFPLVAGIMGLKPEKRAFYLAGVVTLWVFVICRVALPTAWKSLTVPISVVANILSFLLGHLAIHKRLVRIPEARTSHTLWRRAKKKSWHFLPTPRRILRYTQDRVARYGAPYLLFGIFCALHYTIPYFMWSPSASKGHENLAMYLRFVGFLLCVLLMLHENWYEKLKPYLPLFWYVTLLYCIPFVSTMMVLVTNGSTEWLINFALNLVFLIVLVDWVSFLLLSILGSLLGMLMYYLVVGPISLSGFSLPLGHLVAYQGVFFILLGLLFARKKQVTIHQRTRKLVRRTQDQASQLQVATDTHAQLANSLDPQSSVISEMRQATDRLRKGVGNKEDIDRIESALTHLEEIKIKSTRYLPLDPRKESLNEILDMVAKELEILGMENMPKLYCRHSQDRVVCDAAYITKLMVHSIQHVVRYHPGQAVYCYLDDAIIDYGTSKHTKQSLPCYRFTVSNQPQKKPQKQKYGIKNLKLIFGKDKKYLEENEQITQAHYGTMLFHQVGDECTQFYILPYDLNRVRPKITRFADENLQEETQLDAPEDRQFLDLVRKKGLPIQPIEKALLDCKHYHRRDVRKSGEPYYLHPVRAATELLKYTTELDMIIAELLHDTLEDTPYTVHQIASRYGKRVAHLVAEVTNLYSEKARKVKLKKKEKFTKMLEKAEKGPMTIKLFDRLDNLRTIHGHPSRQKRIQIATETLAFFLPIARILGFQPVEKELVELAQQVLDKNKSA